MFPQSPKAYAIGLRWLSPHSGLLLTSLFGGSRSYFDEAQHEPRAGFACGGWLDDTRAILSPGWGGSPIAQRRKPWEHRQHQQPTAPDGATEFIRTSHSSARYGAIQAKCFRDPQGLRHWAMLASAPFGALVDSGFGGSASYFDRLSMSGRLHSLETPRFDIRHSTFGIRHSAFGIRHSALDIRHSTFGMSVPINGVRLSG